ncbi:hypothetical protein QE430_003355 [Microbacterium testaceum]|nr:hypothetical protein [Microbacterium testaceum]
MNYWAVPVSEEAIADSPPRRSRTLLREWVQEFIGQGHLASDVRVVEQEDAAERDTGLVVVGLVHAKGSIHLEPAGYDEPLWQATIEFDDGDLTIPPYVLASLAAELVVADRGTRPAA